ncbi:6585_t:CDS:1, partial [Ambispora leptoticha]
RLSVHERLYLQPTYSSANRSKAVKGSVNKKRRTGIYRSRDSVKAKKVIKAVYKNSSEKLKTEEKDLEKELNEAAELIRILADKKKLLESENVLLKGEKNRLENDNKNFTTEIIQLRKLINNLNEASAEKDNTIDNLNREKGTLELELERTSK